MARTKQRRGGWEAFGKPLQHKQLVHQYHTSGPTMYEYPGLGLPLRHNDQDNYGFYPIGAHGNAYGSDSEPIFVRELAMMDVMEKLTDKPDWHKKVFDDEIVSKWRTEALSIPNEELFKLATSGKHQYWHPNNNGQPEFRDDDPGMMPEGIMSEQAFACCIDELRSKAKHFGRTGIVPTLDAGASVAKSDTLVTTELHEALRAAFDKLKVDQEASPDWHPSSNEMVQDLLHPSMYPLVYGRTCAFQQECVGVEGAIALWAGKGTVVPKEDGDKAADRNNYGYGVGGGSIPPNYWSTIYQWLPANVALQPDGGVKFTSYINNLHPDKYPDIYRTIEKLVETSLPMWDQCLALATGYNNKAGAGRTWNRIPLPPDVDDQCATNWFPDNMDEFADEKLTDEQRGMVGDEPENGDPEDWAEYKWQYLRKPRLPEPSWENIAYAPQEGTRLVDRFQASGLQIIVKMASIELTPEKPDFPVGGWHVEGQMNEHICATSLYYLDSENITNSNLSFRMQTSAYLNDEDDYNVGQDSYNWMSSCFGTGLGCGNSPCLQNYGSVETRQGRLLAFPNVFQHRVSPFKLIDPTKPGHRRFVALWLVDPTKRIISTANVPPQQMSWYNECLFGSTPEARKASLAKLPSEVLGLLQERGLSNITLEADVETARGIALPEELMEMVREHLGAEESALPMSLEEAKEHRAKLMQERGAFVKTAEKGWQQHSYSFCEH